MSQAAYADRLAQAEFEDAVGDGSYQADLDFDWEPAAVGRPSRGAAKRLHGPALAARRSRLGIEERTAFAKEVSQPPAMMNTLPLPENVANLIAFQHAQVVRFFPFLPNVRWWHLGVVWFALFVACFAVMKRRLGEELAAVDASVYPEAAMELATSYVAELPGYFLQVWLACFVFFLALFLGVNFLGRHF